MPGRATEPWTPNGSGSLVSSGRVARMTCEHVHVRDAGVGVLRGDQAAAGVAGGADDGVADADAVADPVVLGVGGDAVDAEEHAEAARVVVAAGRASRAATSRRRGRGRARGAVGAATSRSERARVVRQRLGERAEHEPAWRGRPKKMLVTASPSSTGARHLAAVGNVRRSDSAVVVGLHLPRAARAACR